MIVRDDINDAVWLQLVAINKVNELVVEGNRGATERNYLLALGLIEAYVRDGKTCFKISPEGKELIEREGEA